MIRVLPALRMALLLSAVSMLGACATSRSQISLDVPAPAVVVSNGDKLAVIETVTDQRHFEADPDEPSTPSLKRGDKYTLDADGRKSAIARKRNGYGMAIGDIVLLPPQTVETIARDLVGAGLQQRGYRIVAAGDAPADALRVKVGIDEFWAWLTPGFWALDMESRLKTVMQVGDSQLVTVAAYGKKTAPTAREDNWKQAYDRVFQDYLQKQKAAFDELGL
jgi:hypothetical protein